MLLCSTCVAPEVLLEAAVLRLGLLLHYSGVSNSCSVLLSVLSNITRTTSLAVSIESNSTTAAINTCSTISTSSI
jgi:hypothetical protein